MEEQRVHKRRRVDMKVAFRDEGPSYEIGYVKDISKGGMYVRTEVPVEKDIYILASLDAEEFGKVIWTQGRVVRKAGSGMAIVFTRIDEKGLNTLLSHWGI